MSVEDDIHKAIRRMIGIVDHTRPGPPPLDLGYLHYDAEVPPGKEVHTSPVKAERKRVRDVPDASRTLYENPVNVTATSLRPLRAVRFTFDGLDIVEKIETSVAMVHLTIMSIRNGEENLFAGDAGVPLTALLHWGTGLDFTWSRGDLSIAVKNAGDTPTRFRATLVGRCTRR